MQTIYATPPRRRETNPLTPSPVVQGLQWFFVAIGVIALGCAKQEYLRLLHAPHSTPHSTPHQSFLACASVLDFASYACAVILLLVPWWRLGSIVRVLGSSIFLPSCVYTIAGLLIADVVSIHQHWLFHLMLLSGLLALGTWRIAEIQRKTPDSVKL